MEFQRHAQCPPIGRNCSQTERDDFEKYDKEVGSAKMVKVLKHNLEYNLTYSIGGQISLMCSQVDGTRHFVNSLRMILIDTLSRDKTQKGGNDHEIFLARTDTGHITRSQQSKSTAHTGLVVIP